MFFCLALQLFLGYLTSLSVPLIISLPSLTVIRRFLCLALE
jgi:hypothetical protein